MFRRKRAVDGLNSGSVERGRTSAALQSAYALQEDCAPSPHAIGSIKSTELEQLETCISAFIIREKRDRGEIGTLVLMVYGNIGSIRL